MQLTIVHSRSPVRYIARILVWRQTSFGYRSQILLLLNSTELILVFRSTEKWLSLTYGLASASWSMAIFINLAPRVGIETNHSPTSTMPLMVNAPVRIWTMIEIPMSDADSNAVNKCRWATSSGTLNGLSVDECADAYNINALPSTVTLQTFVTNRCQVNVSLPYAGYYIVAIQIEDFLSIFSTIALRSVTLQFVLYGFDSYNTVTACMTPPIITNILPWSAVNGGNIKMYCFIIESPSGMQKSSFPYAWTTVPYYAMNLT
ncbi:unnamed protein product [Rotaria socialis]|uniref:Uncharacterized protein n=1 Tax=Rotaria socialis TaxID=392032 RepID=A0A818ZAB5_9BILA|nr:unnamed protein product [Rotaria socialis]